MFWMLVFSIPIIAISGGLFINYKKLKWEHEKQLDNPKIQELLKENEDMKKRLSHIEEIITSQEWEQLAITSKDQKPSLEDIRKIIS